MSSETSSILPEEHDAATATAPTLDRLVGHLLAAKRSLSCVEHVARANELVTSARRALETHTILTAQTLFIHNGCRAQARIIEQVHAHCRHTAEEMGHDFRSVLHGVDVAEQRLRTTLDQLKATIVEPQLRPHDSTQRTLADFVHETGVQGLLDQVRESVAGVEEERRTFQTSLDGLRDDSIQVQKLLSSSQVDHTSQASLKSIANLHSPVPDILQSSEDAAQDMASNLESLVKHFDLCVIAIKNTEGGGAAASKIVHELPAGLDVDLGRNIDDNALLEPLPEDERREMLEVLEQDAAEVDDVVADIRDRLAEMESLHVRVNEYTTILTSSSQRAHDAVRLLESVGQRLPTYLAQGHVFRYRWDESRGVLETQIHELISLRSFYAGFLRAYDDLLVEVGRRQDMSARIARACRDARARLTALVDEEEAARAQFRHDQGDFLPSDIWPGLMTAPARYEVVVSDDRKDTGASHGKTERGAAEADRGSIAGDSPAGATVPLRDKQGPDSADSVDSVPSIAASVIRSAIRRVTAREAQSENEDEDDFERT